MKNRLLLAAWLLSTFFVGGGLIGCAPQSKMQAPYSLLDRLDGPVQITLYVEVPRGATKDQLEAWAQKIKTSEGDGRREVMMNFYHGGRSEENMIASYQGGAVYVKTDKAPTAPTTPPSQTLRSIMYTVIGKGRASINYKGSDGKLVSVRDAELPWTVTVKMPIPSLPAVYAHAIEAAQYVTVAVWADGKIIAEAEGEDTSVTVDCSEAGCAEQRE